MINRLRNTSTFFIPYLILFGIALIFFFYQSHGDFVLWLNDLHNPIWNFFFKYWTHTGSVFFYAAVAIFFIVVRRRFGIMLSIIGVTIAAISFLFKQVLFNTSPRPRIYFEGQKLLDFVDGVNVLSFHSFPSGHSMAVFAMASFLAFMFQNRQHSWLLLIGASLTAVSRVYLSQHFLIDIMAGSLIGLIVSTSFYMAFEKYLNREKTGAFNTPDEDLEELDLENEDVN
ncbi:Membrane-associated phospholipid phosphatase [Ekhidna lutea]|uniref:Membrane-associated phospholipid phosphatase n=1 Tax=Ekhidna lutea TaxID=447679 RepID=A0A239KFU9_EKHLU|nr:phosphatase PAP2 family protein [Ekhidna lutea]SNT16582.1 Membrane-associated phospholipid phosphatase [Ekhidna lutea]